MSSRIAFQSEARRHEGTPDALVIHCSDHRFQRSFREFLVEGLFEGAADNGGIGRTLLGCFGKHFLDLQTDPYGNCIWQGPRCSFQVLIHQGHWAIGGDKGCSTGKHLIGHDTQSIEVRSRIGNFSSPLFGCHVSRGTR